MDWAQILVFILATVLAIFLILSVVLVAMLIKITTQIKSVTSAAQRTAERMEKAATVKQMVQPLLVLGTLLKRMNRTKSRRKNKDEE